MIRLRTFVAAMFVASSLGGAMARAADPVSDFDLRPSVQYLAAAANEPATQAIPDNAQEMAQKLSNPISSLISVPFQNNIDFNQGTTGHQFQYTLNVQPVIPFELNKDWNLILRSIQPFIYQEANISGPDSNLGWGDNTSTAFFSPQDPVRGWIIGAGPVVLLPIATDSGLGSGQFGFGPSVVVLQQTKETTYGMLWNHIWSIWGDDDRPSVNQSFFQPFFAYNMPGGLGLTVQTETTYNWSSGQWTVPIGFFVSQIFKIDKQLMQANFGPRIYAEGPSDGPTVGLRFTLTFLFPK